MTVIDGLRKKAEALAVGRPGGSRSVGICLLYVLTLGTRPGSTTALTSHDGYLHELARVEAEFAAAVNASRLAQCAQFDQTPANVYRPVISTAALEERV